MPNALEKQTKQPLLKVYVDYADFRKESQNIAFWHRYYLAKGSTRNGWVAPIDVYDYLQRNPNKPLKVQVRLSYSEYLWHRISDERRSANGEVTAKTGLEFNFKKRNPRYQLYAYDYINRHP